MSASDVVPEKSLGTDADAINHCGIVPVPAIVPGYRPAGTHQVF